MPGMDPSRFDQPVDEDFICSICLCVLLDPVHDSCDHLFCADCIRLWLEKSDGVTLRGKCPLCQDAISWSELKPASRIIKNLLANLMVFCKYRESGCLQLVKYEVIDGHEKVCIYQQCLKGCGATLNGSQKHECIPYLKSIVQELTQNLGILLTISDLNNQEIDQMVSTFSINVPTIEKELGQLESNLVSVKKSILKKKPSTSVEVMYLSTSSPNYFSEKVIRNIICRQIICNADLSMNSLRPENFIEVLHINGAGLIRVFKVITTKQSINLITKPELWPREIHCVIPGEVVRGFQGAKEIVP